MGRHYIGFGDLSSLIHGSLHGQVDIANISERLWVAPVPFFPAFTFEAYFMARLSMVDCCSDDGTLGRYVKGAARIEVSGGIGTSIGGASGIKAFREKNGHGGKTLRYKDSKRRYVPKPTNEDGFEKSAVTAQSSSLRLKSCPKVNAWPEIVLEVGISGFASGGMGWFSVGAQFNTVLGECHIPGGCEWKNPRERTDAGIVTGLGTGARIQVYGRADVDVVMPL